MKIYKPNADPFESEDPFCVDVVDDVAGTVEPLQFPGGVHAHSPDGFAWGYGGSGPAELARAILGDHLGREPSTHTYQDFKFAKLAKLDPKGLDWKITSDEIAAWLGGRRA